MWFYRIVKNGDGAKRMDDLEELERHFTSSVFEVLNPAKRNKELSKIADLDFSNSVSREEFMEKNPGTERLFTLSPD